MQCDLSTMNFPQAQIALDFIDGDRALAVAREAVRGGVRWLEAGTPLIKSEGLNIVRQLRAEFPQCVIIADLKTMDAGRLEVEAAARAGADIAVCLGAATDATVAQCVEAGRKYGVKIYGDTIGLQNPAARAAELEKIGVDFIGAHCPIDEQMQGQNPLEKLREIVAAVKIPVAVAGGITAQTAPILTAAGASVIIVGGAITKSPNAEIAAAQIVASLTAPKNSIHSADAKTIGIRAGNSDAEIREMLLKASAANLSDALHHAPALRGVVCRTPGLRCAGKAVTVRSFAGDWNCVVRAIDVANEHDVIVADCGGVPPAVWGECATLSAINRKIGGVVIFGAVRDTDAALALKLPIFSAAVCPDAGEPRGFGEINGILNINGQIIRSGDWVVGDDDGVMILAKEKAVEYANRAVDVMESELRLKAEIIAGGTLGKISRLDKWQR